MNKKSKEQKDLKGNKKGKCFPNKFPFWARLKIGKNRTTLVIDEAKVLNKRTKKQEEGFVHREATSTASSKYEEINPNPDKSKSKPMYLKKPTKKPKSLFKPHNKQLSMPEYLRKKYEKNNEFHIGAAFLNICNISRECR